VQQGGLYAWIEPILRNTSMLVIPYLGEFITMPTKKQSNQLESIYWGQSRCISLGNEHLHVKILRIKKRASNPVGYEKTNS
jgi:hypothetical protein